LHRTALGRFIARVRLGDGCWLWQGGRCAGGYGVLRGDGGRVFLAHRFSYLMFVGEIPAGLEVDHLCGVKACVRPEHLEAVSHSVNMQRHFASRAAR
jgi:hypothetical protein